MLLKISQNSHDNTCARVSFSIYLKKRLWHKCFPWICAKFLRTSFLTEHLRWLLLRIRAAPSSTISRSKIFFHVNLGHIKFLHVNSVWDYSLFIEQDFSDVKNVALSEFVVFFSILNIYTLNIKNTVTRYISNWYTQE